MSDKKQTHILLSAIILVSLFVNHCAPANNKRMPMGPAWFIHIPKTWALTDSGSKGLTTTFRVYKREAIIKNADKKIIPSCVITNEEVSEDSNLADFATERETRIISSMELKGYKLTAFRKDILRDLKGAFKSKIVLCLVYEFSYREDQAHYIGIAIYAKRKINLLNINIESRADTYSLLRPEIMQIIASIR